jgi:hypothetical protein
LDLIKIYVSNRPWTFIARNILFHGYLNNAKSCAAQLLKALSKKLELQVLLKNLTTL